ncbi:MAG: methyltransferase domain-containing protein [Candidatus Thorarchaeota archaeon]
MSFKRTLRTVEILRVFKLLEHKPKKILDFGYGDGQITNSLHKRGYNIIGLDNSKGNYEKAKNWFPECDFRLYDGLNIPFEENNFDTVILNDVLEHIPYDLMERLIVGIKKVLKTEGIIYISVTNRYNLIEPHTRIPLITWLPKIFWKPFEKIYKSRSNYRISNIYPYTFKRLSSFCKRHKLNYEDYTSVYISHKLYDLDYIGNRYVKFLVKLLKAFGLINLFYYLAYKFSVIIYACKLE